MSNVLSEERKQQVLALARLGWPLRRIQAATGVRRETARAYLRQAGIATRGPGRPPRLEAKPAITASQVSTDFGPGDGGPVVPPGATRSPQLSACEPYRELIELALSRRRNAMAIYQDLVDWPWFPRRLRKRQALRAQARRRARRPEARGIILTDPGEEASGRLRRGADGASSRHGKVPSRSALRPDPRLQPQVGPPPRLPLEHARLGGAPREGVPSARRHVRRSSSSTICARACSSPTSTTRRSIPSTATASRTTAWSRSRAACAIPIARERSNPASATPSERRSRAFASRRSRRRSVSRSLGDQLGRHPHPRHHQAPSGGDVCRREADAASRSRSSPSASTSTATAPCTSTDTSRWRSAYYSVPARSHRRRSVWVQWDDYQVRILDPQQRSTACASTCRHRPGNYRTQDEDRPPRMPRGTQDSAARAPNAAGAAHRRALPARSTPATSETRRPAHPRRAVARPQVRSRCRQRCLCRGARARRADLPLRAPLPRAPSPRRSSRCADRSADPRAHPLPRSHRRSHRGGGTMNLVELQRSLRQLRLGGMAHALETRLHRSAERTAGADRLPLHARLRRAHRPRRSAAAAPASSRPQFRDPDKTLDAFDFDFNKKMNRRLVFELATGHFIDRARGRALPRPARHRQESPRSGHRPRRHPAGPPRPLPRSAHPARRARRCHDRRHPQETIAELPDRAAAHHRRPRHAQAPRHRRRGSPRNHHAPPRAGEHAHDLQPSRRRLGQAARRHPGRHRDARSAARARSRPRCGPRSWRLRRHADQEKSLQEPA